MAAAQTDQLTAPRTPGAVWWALVFNLIMTAAGLGLWWVATFGLAVTDYAAIGLSIPLAALVLFVLVLSVRLQRGCAWAWVAELVLICLAVGLAPFPGLLWVPLLVAWCSPTVRDWFDPPMHREF